MRSGLLPGDFAGVFVKGDLKLGLVGLNTAFLHLAQSYCAAPLALHTEQFQAVCGGDGPAWINRQHANLLLTHHPPECLSADAQQHFDQEITPSGYFAAHLCGHLHVACSLSVSEAGTEPRRRWQGRALFGLEFFGAQETRLHGYTAGRIEFDGAQGRLLFWPREARLQGGQRTLTPDYGYNLTDDHHLPAMPFSLLQPYAASNAPSQASPQAEQPIKSATAASQVPKDVLRKIKAFLTSLDPLKDAPGQKAFIFGAGLDKELKEQIRFGLSSGEFVALCVEQALSYGALHDGCPALHALLETAKQYVGPNRQVECDALIQAAQPKPTEPPESTPSDSTATAPPTPADKSGTAAINAQALRAAYLHRVLDLCGQMPLSGIDRKTASRATDASLSLGAIYTALLTLQAERPESGQGSEPWQSMPGGAERQEMRRVSAVAQLNAHKRLVLLGDPGSGKSTFVNFVAICLAGAELRSDCADLDRLTAPLPDDKGQPAEERQPWDHGSLLPVRVILRDFAAESLPPENKPATAAHLWQFIAARLQEAELSEYAGHLRKHLQETGGLVFLDGLDEVPEAHDHRAQIKQAVEDFARSFPHCRILVTSRTYAYQRQEWRLSGFEEATLAPFTQGQILRFVEQWYAQSARLLDMRPDDAAHRAELLKQAILRNPRLFSFAQRPLLLTLMASLHAWRGGSLPERREELYNDAVELLLDWWETRKVKGKVQSLSEVLQLGREGVEGLRRTISALAYEAHAAQPELTGTANISEDRLAAALMRLSENTNLDPRQMRRYVRERTGLLVSHGVEMYTFPHRTFQEYLAAWHLTEDANNYPDNVAQLARTDPNRWREVALLAGAKAARGAAATVWDLAEALCFHDLAPPPPSPTRRGGVTSPLSSQERGRGRGLFAPPRLSGEGGGGSGQSLYVTVNYLDIPRS